MCEILVKQNNGPGTRYDERFAPVSGVAPTKVLAGNDVYIYCHLTSGVTVLYHTFWMFLFVSSIPRRKINYPKKKAARKQRFVTL